VLSKFVGVPTKSDGGPSKSGCDDGGGEAIRSDPGTNVGAVDGAFVTKPGASGAATKSGAGTKALTEAAAPTTFDEALS